MNNKKLVLTNWEIKNNRIEYFFNYPSKIAKYYKDKKQTSLFIEYPSDCDLTKIPASVLMIPFVANMLTMTMLLNIAIEVPELDQEFYNSLKNIKASYKSMFPYINFNFDVRVKNLVNNQIKNTTLKESLFFTGGLDATSGLIELLKSPSHKRLTLINIWGGDINPNDILTHKNLESYFENLKSTFNVDYKFIRSNCRDLYNEKIISRFTALKIHPWHNHGWWASIAHILSMSSLIAPLAYLYGIRYHYISSSYEASNRTFDANNETMVNSIKFTNCELKSLDKDLDRTQKAHKIVSFCKNHNVNFLLKVCWYHHNGENCSHCEKCYRTILDIIVNKGDPNLYGFCVNNKTFNEIHNFLLNNYVNSGYWKPIQIKFQNNSEYWMNKPEISWILNFKFNGFKLILKKGMQVLNKFKTSYK